jgi:hypothetical protein
VSVVQNATISLADDVAATKRILAMQSMPVILVGHSYGGVVITEAGNDPKVASVVYHQTRVEDEAELVPDRHRRQDDSPPAQHFMSTRAGSTVVGTRQSRDLRVQAGSRGRLNQDGRQRCEIDFKVSFATTMAPPTATPPSSRPQAGRGRCNARGRSAITSA